MSEQKMPALPELGIDTAAHYGPRIRGYTVEQAERIRAEAIEFGRQQEREAAAARRMAEGVGEPVAWRWPGGVWQDGDPSLTDKAQLKAAGVKPEFAYTTPPSADALVEALEKLSAEWRAVADHALRRSGTWSGHDMADRVDHMARELDAALAAHKENTDGR